MFAFFGLASAAPIHNHQERSFIAHMREHSLSYTGDEYNLRLGIYLSLLNPLLFEVIFRRLIFPVMI
jgi:hypothetical protein